MLGLILIQFVGLILFWLVHPDLIVFHYGKSCFKLGFQGQGVLDWYDIRRSSN